MIGVRCRHGTGSTSHLATSRRGLTVLVGAPAFVPSVTTFMVFTAIAATVVIRAEERLNNARDSRVEACKGLALAAYRIKTLIGELTAKDMNLKVEYFEPEAEFKKIKMKIVGF